MRTPPSSRADSSVAIDVAAEIEQIVALPIHELRALWRATFGVQPPECLTKDLLARRLTYQLQEQVFGGLPPKIAGALRSAETRGAGVSPRARVGSVIIREFAGTVHEVLVTPEGYCWRGKTFSSLSTIALEITGTVWNGPRFFGLRGRETKTSGRREDRGPPVSAHASHGGAVTGRAP